MLVNYLTTQSVSAYTSMILSDELEKLMKKLIVAKFIV
jgi:hypothetical protein